MYDALPDFITRLKNMKDIRSFTEEGVLGDSLRNDTQTVNLISKHGIIGTTYLRDHIILIKSKIP